MKDYVPEAPDPGGTFTMPYPVVWLAREEVYETPSWLRRLLEFLGYYPREVFKLLGGSARIGASPVLLKRAF